ncbi:phosphotransferase [Xylophilus ampelinus]|nr:phosphotransferase [Xylophilus ampelinus]
MFAEMAVLDAIQATDILDVSRPIEDRSGCWFSEVSLPPDNMARVVGVFRPAKGIEPAGSLHDYQRIGQALADLHRQTHLAKIAQARNPGPGAGSTTIALRSTALAAAIAASAKLLEDKGATQHLGPVGFCHGDIRLSNLRISSEKMTLFDFDDCGIRPQLLDVAAIAFWLEVGKQHDSAGLWAAFLEGYGIKSG